MKDIQGGLNFSTKMEIMGKFYDIQLHRCRWIWD